MISGGAGAGAGAGGAADVLGMLVEAITGCSEGVRKCAGQRVVSGGVGGGDTPDTSTKSQMCNQVCINPGRGLKGLLSPAIWCEVRRGAESDYGRLE